MSFFRDLNLSAATAGFVAVLVGLALALKRSGRSDASTPPNTSGLTAPERRLQRNVTIGVAVTVVLLVVMLCASVFTDRALARLPLADAVRLDITAHQWWWEVKYVDDEPAKIFVTANEIQVPVVLAKTAGHALGPITAMALGTGARRGELLAVAWSSVELDAARVHITRAIEQTKGQIRFKAPKTASGTRTLSLPANVVAAGGCRMRWNGRMFDATDPEIVGADVGIPLFNRLERPILRLIGTERFLTVRAVEA